VCGIRSWNQYVVGGVWLFDTTAGYWTWRLKDLFEGQEGNMAQTG
jgi:hypothetical protein